MPAPVTWPADKQFIGVAKETTPGTAVAMTFTQPVEKFDPEDKPTPLIDKALRGSMVEEYGYVQGVIRSEFSFSGPAFMDGLGFWLNNILGDLTTTGASAPFSHAFSTLNSGQAQPGTLSITDWQGPPATNFARIFTGCCLSELTLKGNAESELISLDAKGTGWRSSIAAAPPTSAPTTATPLASWRTQLGIGGPAAGGTLDNTIGAWEVKINRKIKPVFTGQNSQNPFIIQRGSITASAKLDFAAPAAETNALLMLLNNTQPQFQWLVDNGLTLGAALGMTVDCQAAAFDTAKIDRGSEIVMYSDTFKAIANSTNAGASGGVSPLKITLRNALPAGTF